MVDIDYGPVGSGVTRRPSAKIQDRPSWEPVYQHIDDAVSGCCGRQRPSPWVCSNRTLPPVRGRCRRPILCALAWGASADP